MFKKSMFKKSEKMIAIENEYRGLLIALYEEQLNDYRAEAAPGEKLTTIEHILSAAILMLHKPGKNPKEIEEWVVQTEKFWRKK